MKNYDELYSKIMRRLNSAKIQSTSEVVSAADVRDAVYEAMSLYNVILSVSTENTAKKLNRSIGYGRITLGKKRLPKVKSIYNTIDENAEAFVSVYFENKGKIILTGDEGSVKVFNTTLNTNDVIDFVNANKEIFSIYLGCLKEFASNYPSVKMNFGQNAKNTYDQKIDDGFLSCTVQLTEPEKTQVLFSSIMDQSLSADKTSTYGELYDYVSFYNDEILQKIAINTSELNPFVKACVEQYLNNKEDISFTLSK